MASACACNACDMLSLYCINVAWALYAVRCEMCDNARAFVPLYMKEEIVSN